MSANKVLTGDNITHEIVSVGIVRIRMHDGMVRTLLYVRHVPSLKKNLISLGVLDSVSCKYVSQGGVLRVSKGALKIFKGQMCGGFYLLNCDTIVGTMSSFSSSFKVMDFILETLLWIISSVESLSRSSRF